MAEATCCPVKTDIMEPRGTRSRRRAGSRREQEDRPSGGGELPSGSAESSGGAGGEATLFRGGSSSLPETLPAVRGRQTLASAPNHPAGRQKQRRGLQSCGLACLSDSLTSEGKQRGFLFPEHPVLLSGSLLTDGLLTL